MLYTIGLLVNPLLRIPRQEQKIQLKMIEQPNWKAAHLGGLEMDFRTLDKRISYIWSPWLKPSTILREIQLVRPVSIVMGAGVWFYVKNGVYGRKEGYKRNLRNILKTLMPTVTKVKYNVVLTCVL